MQRGPLRGIERDIAAKRVPALPRGCVPARSSGRCPAFASRLLRSERLQHVHARRARRRHQRRDNGGNDERDGGAQDWEGARQGDVPEVAGGHTAEHVAARHTATIPIAAMTAPSDRTPKQQVPRCRPDRQPHAELARARAHRERQHARHPTTAINSATPANPESTKAFSRSGASFSARTSSSVAARSTGWFADISRMVRVIAGTSAYGSSVACTNRRPATLIC